MAKLKELRAEKGLSQADLSKYIDISIKTIQAYEQGRRELSGAGIDTILKICNCLGCDLKTLFEDEPKIYELLEKIDK